jgi:hypothetical protein
VWYQKQKRELRHRAGERMCDLEISEDQRLKTSKGWKDMDSPEYNWNLKSREETLVCQHFVVWLR